LAEVGLDGRVLAFTLAVATFSGLLVSLLPAWQLATRDVQSTLRAGGAVIGADRVGLRSRAALLTLQVAVSVMLLVVTGLLGISLMRVLSVDPGFRADQVMAIPVALPTARYASGAERTDVYERMLTDVRRVPGVRAVSPTSMLPMRGEGQVNFIVAAGREVPRAEPPTANFRLMAPEYFETLQLPLESGQPLPQTSPDSTRPVPAVISESVAARLWPGENALGHLFGRGIDGEGPFEVVGVAIDARTTSLEHTPPLMGYVPYWWQPRAATSLLVRTAVAPTAIVPDVRRVIRQIDPEIAVGDSRTLEDLVAAATAGRRYQAQLFVAFGIVAMFIATLGVYAVTAYSLSRRRRELNIRVALGAQTRQVVGLIVRQTGVPVAIGIVLGVGAALLLGGTLATLLYDVRPRDPLVLTAVRLIVGVVAIAATFIATRRGLSLNPVAALHHQRARFQGSRVPRFRVPGFQGSKVNTGTQETLANLGTLNFEL
jgi:predicted permease